MAYSCNPSYLGDRDWEDHGLMPDQAKKVCEIPSQQKHLDVVECTCHPVTEESNKQ
jgi:hypothetical protein